jgi:hypothetical protein
MSTQGSSRAPRFAAVAAGLALAVVAAVSVVAVPAFGAGDFGPDTCLNGFVWREAVPADHVCVTPDVRTQAAADNAQAAARRSPTGGPYGPDTCLQGYVWREAVAGDHVCVTPPTRDQARNDNLSAAARRNELRTAISTYVPPHVTCDGDVCTTTSDDAARYRVRADRINVGQARVVLFSSSTRRALRSWWVSVPANTSAPGGYLSFRTGMLQCPGAANAYFRVQDGSSGRWSVRLYVATGCSTL